LNYHIGEEMVFEKGSSGRKLFFTGIFVSLSWCLLSLVILCLLPGLFERLNHRIYDLKMFYRAEPAGGSPIVHLDVDDQAVRKYGQWPWDRRMSARIVDRLSKLGARVIALDILYTSDGRSKQGDQAFFGAISRARRVVTAFAPIAMGLQVRKLKIGRDRARADALYDRAWNLNTPPSFSFFRVATLRDSGLPLLPIIQSAVGLGHIKATPDEDGVHRRIPLLIQLEDRFLPSLSLAALAAYLDVGPDAITVSPAGHIEIRHGQGMLEIPIDSHANLLLNWRPTLDGFPHYSVLDLFAQDPDPNVISRYKGKIVIVGVTWTGSTDVGTNPLFAEVWLSRVHSSGLDTILAGRFTRKIPFFYTVMAACVIVTILFLLAAVRMRLQHGIILSVSICLIFAALVIGAFLWGSLEIPSVQPFFVFLPAAAAFLAFLAISTDKERDLIRDTFGRYLSEDVVTEILKSRGGVNLTGELREMTILITDLRGFTPMTESLEPSVVLKVINRYFERMTDIVMRHGGTVDQFTGDGILVFFGAPREQPDHASRALACALEMQDSMRDLNEGNLRLSLPELRMGIGIETGDLIVGNIGSEKRKTYGAVGSPINVAFRVEALAAGGEILVTPSVYERLADELEVSETGEVSLKGISEPMTLYSVIGMKTSPS